MKLIAFKNNLERVAFLNSIIKIRLESEFPVNKKVPKQPISQF